MMLRWISLVPAEIVYCRAATRRLNQRGASGTSSDPWFTSACMPSNSPAASAIRTPISVPESFRIEPSGPGASPRICRVSARKRVYFIASQSISSCESRWRMRGSSHAVCPSTGSRRATAMRSRTWPTGLRAPDEWRSYISVVVETFQPAFSGPSSWLFGTITSVKNTSLKWWWPVASTSGRTLTPGALMSTSRHEMPLCLGTLGSVRTSRMIEALRPPYSLGHAMPTQPALCIAFCHATRRSNIARVEATRSSTGSSTRSSAGRFAASQPRNSLRNVSCSSVYSKSMGPSLRVRGGRQSAEPGQHVEERAEVALAQAEAARHRQPLLRERGGGQRDAGGMALVQRELEILLHHADVEPCLARHGADDVRPSVLHHRRGDHRLQQRLHRRLAREPRLLVQQ